MDEIIAGDVDEEKQEELFAKNENLQELADINLDLFAKRRPDTLSADHLPRRLARIGRAAE